MTMQVGRTYITEKGTQEEVLLVRDGIAYCASPSSRPQTLYGWDAETGQSLSLNSQYDIRKTVVLSEVPA